MTIHSALPQPLPRSADEFLQPHRGHGEPPPGGFGAVLKGLLSFAQGGSFRGESQLSASGDQPQAFEQARLLCAQALQLGHGPMAASRRSSAEGPVDPPTAPLSPAVLELKHAGMAESAVARAAVGLAPQAAAAGEAGGTQTPLAVAPSNSRGGMPSAAIIAPSQPNAPLSAPAPAAARSHTPSSPVRAGSGPASAPPQGANAAFLFRLLSQEDGALVMLRLPALADAERAELQARVAALLESHGHRRHRLIVQQMSGGI